MKKPLTPEQRVEKYAAYFDDWGVTPATPYEKMVAVLFKKNPDNNFMAHHATTGLAGESGELRDAYSFDNAIEESGDFRFYMVALRQRLSLRPGGVEQTKEVVESRFYIPTHGMVMDNLHSLSSNLLDLTKKSWIYGRELKQYEIWQQLSLLEINFRYWVEEVMGTDVELDVESKNMEKLLTGDNARYKEGIYSDAQALARADKGGEE